MDQRPECFVNEIPVLMYHSIAIGATRKFRRFTVDPAEFAAHMDYLDIEGYHPLTAAELVASGSGRALPARPVVLTFDDAYDDFHSTALPILRKHGFRAALYVPTAYVGGTMRFLGCVGEEHRAALSWQELGEIAAEVSRLRRTAIRILKWIACPLKLSARRSIAPGACWKIISDWRSSGSAIRSAIGTVQRAPLLPPPVSAMLSAVDELMTASGHDVLTQPRLTVNAGIGVSGLARLLEGATRRSAVGKRQQQSGSSGRWFAGWCLQWAEIHGKAGTLRYRGRVTIERKQAVYREPAAANSWAASSRLVALIVATGVLVVAVACTAWRVGISSTAVRSPVSPAAPSAISSPVFASPTAQDPKVQTSASGLAQLPVNAALMDRPQSPGLTRPWTRWEPPRPSRTSRQW